MWNTDVPCGSKSQNRYFKNKGQGEKVTHPGANWKGFILEVSKYEVCISNAKNIKT